MPTGPEIAELLMPAGLTPSERQNTRDWFSRQDSVNSQFSGGNELEVDILKTKYGQSMFRAAQTKIANAAQQVSSFTWTIPSEGTHLEIRIDCASERTNLTSPLSLRFNGDSGANYAAQADFSKGGTPEGETLVNRNQADIISIVGDDAVANSTSSVYIVINNYGNTNLHKGILTLSGIPGGSAPTDAVALNSFAWWKSTDAIRTITILDTLGENWTVGSIFSLYVLP